MSDVKWIKIVTDIFDDEKILLIEAMPECDSIIVIWFKLLCMAGKQNNGGVFLLNDRIAYTDEMLATIFRRPLNTVRLALQTFEQFGMVEIVNDTITIPNWDKHQSLDRIQKNRDQTRKRVAAFRERQRLIAAGESEVDGDETQCNDDVTDDVTRYSPVTKRNVTQTEREREGEGEEEREGEKKNINTIISHLNEKAGTHYRSTTPSTVRLLHRLLTGEQPFTVQDCITVIDKKCAEWIGSDMEKYLRPETLFGGKFESYLNARTSSRQLSKPNQNAADAYSTAKLLELLDENE